MRTSRLYIDTPLAEQQIITLDGERSNYIAKVLRLKIGTEISVFNGRGGEYLASITDIKKRSTTLKIGRFSNQNNESPLSITLIQGISRGERMDFTLQKATELGVNCIIPIFSERCTVNLKEDRLSKRLLHWQGIIRSACEQSGRNTLPKLHTAEQFDSFLEHNDKSCKILLDPESKQTLQSIAPTSSSICILIGPEGGFSKNEREKAYANGYQGVQLGPRILRTETAAIATISAMQALWGDFK